MANRLVRRSLLLAAWFMIGLFLSSMSWADDSCIDCHDQLAVAFSNTYHGRVLQGQAVACFDCHGDAARHLEDPSPANIISYAGRARADKEKFNSFCLECHQSEAEVSLWPMSRHGRAGLACVDCHQVHRQSSAVEETQVCFKCHGSTRMAAGKFSHHPLNEKKIKCSDCHNSHGSLTPGELTDDSINQLCYGCHADKRGPFIHEHPPVEENCLTCHDPHGSRHDNLLSERVVTLCQNCHNPGSLHANRPYDERSASAMAGRAASIGLVGRSCLNCHGRIHGSSHFDDRGFSR